MYDIITLIKKVFRDCEADFAKKQDVYTKQEVDEILENTLVALLEEIDAEIDNQNNSDNGNTGD